MYCTIKHRHSVILLSLQTLNEAYNLPRKVNPNPWVRETLFMGQAPLESVNPSLLGESINAHRSVFGGGVHHRCFNYFCHLSLSLYLPLSL